MREQFILLFIILLVIKGAHYWVLIQIFNILNNI